MILYVDTRFDTIAFALRDLERSLERRGVFSLRRRLSDAGQAKLPQPQILIDIDAVGEGLSESYAIRRSGDRIEVTGSDHVGAMYGVLDLAETIEMFGFDGVVDKRETPFHEIRGVKFNLPVEPYDTGDPIEKNYSTFLDSQFWEKYIDFLARNRYNCLSLWSEHPFHMMFRLAKYPDTCPYDEIELQRYKDLFKFIFAHARKRGIRTYIITWNIRMIPAVAAGLGLPVELGEMSERYDYVYRKHLGIPQNIKETYSIR